MFCKEKVVDEVAKMWNNLFNHQHLVQSVSTDFSWDGIILSPSNFCASIVCDSHVSAWGFYFKVQNYCQNNFSHKQDISFPLQKSSQFPALRGYWRFHCRFNYQGDNFHVTCWLAGTFLTQHIGSCCLYWGQSYLKVDVGKALQTYTCV